MRAAPHPTVARAATAATGGPVVGRRRRAGFGVATVLLGLVAIVAFGVGSGTGLDATFVLSRSDDAVRLPDVTVPARATGIALGSATTALGALVVAGLVRRHVAVAVGVGLALFVLALLAWAARGDDTNLVGLLDGTLFRATPLALGAFAGLLCERAGVVNIAIEGMLLTSAFVGAVTASAAGSPWVGLACGAAAGALLGWFLGVLSITYRVDQVIGGTVINILALGLTSYLAARILADEPDLNQPGSFGAVGLPGLERLPVVGDLLFRNTVYVHAAFLLVPALWWGLFRTRAGLRLRAVGEQPRAAATVGIDVLRTRYRAVVLGGTVAGIGGTWFTLDSTGSFNENMTAGRGFIALAALIFGRWHPVGAFVAALVFAFSEELQTRLALLDTPVPSDFLLMLPYVVTIVAVAGLVGRSRAPAADGQPYVVE
ncbi:MAG TPA: ABC transporter permease [Acidimicrobiales bacterium]|nr:ABC transporter permease [Acidimicrobiales bacterium]